MSITRARIARKRGERGSAIAELGPALLILFLFLFFPLVDLMSLGVIYMSCATLNDLQLREAALLSKAEAQDPAGRVRKGIADVWQQSGLGQFVKVVDSPATTVSYSQRQDDEVVVVTTNVTASPFLTIPLFPGVPGLGAPVSFTFANERLVENPETGG